MTAAADRDSQVKTVGITGSTGLVGRALTAQLAHDGKQVFSLVRRMATEPREIQAECEAGVIDATKLQGLDALVHLAGDNIAGGRWTPKRKARIRDSRVLATRRLCETLAELSRKPRVLVTASAVGFYGDRGEDILTENSPAGTGFLPEVCQAWEEATHPARDAGIRVVNLRIGIVLSKQGGALAKMLTPFRLGLGGKVGSGRQYWSWIELSDLVRLIAFALEREELRGPVNAVAPDATTNAEFTATLGRELRRPTVLPMPAFAAKLLLGEMARDLLLASQRIVPQKALSAGFRFTYPKIDDALRAALQ